MNRVELWLVRHGETTRSARGEIAGWADPPLTARGEAEAEALRAMLAGHTFATVWSSDLARAVTTARLAHGEPQQDRRLRELHFGALEGRRWGQLDAACLEQLMEFRDFAAPNGESVSELRQRLDAFVAGLGPGRHLVFTHGGAVRAVARDVGVDRFVATGSVVVLDWTHQQLLQVYEQGCSSAGRPRARRPDSTVAR